MKSSIAILTSLFLSLNLSAQKMNEVTRVVTQLFVATDQQNWEMVEACFAENILLDYSSMNGNPAASLSPQEITSAWKGVLPGFTHSHHQLGNFLLRVEQEKAHVFCYGTATHFLEDENGNVWTVVGSYDFDLEKQSDGWKITTMTFNYKYQDGNEALIQKAIENAKP